MILKQDDQKTVVILNPIAGKGKGLKHFPAIMERLTQTFTNLDTQTSEYPGHSFELSREAVKNNYHRIISIGGDGTPFEIINGMLADGVPAQPIQLGMIPAGTGNSFLRDFDGIHGVNWTEKVCALQPRAVDLIQFSYLKDGQEITCYFINILGIGLIADILKLTNERLKFLGSLGYSVAVLVRLFRPLNNRITLSVDGQEYHLKNSALVISNSKYTGGEMKIAPMANTSDGKVDLIVFNDVSRRDILSIFAGVFKGTHVHHPKVKVLSGSTITIEAEPPLQIMADGELLGLTGITLKVLAGQLTILT